MKVGDRMIDTIEITIHNGIFVTKNALIVPQAKVCYYNNRKYNVEDSWIQEIINMIFHWNHEYGSTSDIDIEEFDIKIIGENKETTDHGKGIYPHNYESLKEHLEALV